MWIKPEGFILIAGIDGNAAFCGYGDFPEGDYHFVTIEDYTGEINQMLDYMAIAEKEWMILYGSEYGFYKRHMNLELVKVRLP